MAKAPAISDVPVESKTNAVTATAAPHVQQVIEPEGLDPLYANFVRVAGLPEEMVLDFGLNPQPFGSAPAPVKVSQRLIVNYYTAKRLWLALGAFLQRHEQAFGPVEIDVTKRVLPQPQRPAQ